jgi:transcriptional regulator with XRE-family HTH domain
MENKRVTRMYILRVDRGLRQKDVEKVLGMTHTVYSAIETGRMNKPWPYVIHKLEEFYGKPISFLLEEVEDTK